MNGATVRGIRATQLGLVVNAFLAVAKIAAGVVGTSYALVADGIESVADIFASTIVWSGIRIASRDPDHEYPFGYGKAESIAAATVALMLLGAATGIAIAAVRELLTPHHTPAPFTLVVLALVILIKEWLFRRVSLVGERVGSHAVMADAWHHRSDAITSAAAFAGISIALLGGPGWESADDWAALLAAVVIAWNGQKLLRVSVAALMDRTPGREVLSRVEAIAKNVPQVLAIEKTRIRRAGMFLFIDLHVQADPLMPLRDAHILGGTVKRAIMDDMPAVRGVLVHMEPYED